MFVSTEGKQIRVVVIDDAEYMRKAITKESGPFDDAGTVNPLIGCSREVGGMKSDEYIRKEERIIGSLQTMLDRSIRRMEVGKDVPPYLLKEIIELLQLYVDVSHIMRQEIILSLFGARSADTLWQGCRDGRVGLRKYERFLLEVIEAYDLGYQGARRVFPHYARQYVLALRQHVKLERDLVGRLTAGRDRHDAELSAGMQQISYRLGKERERGLTRMNMLKRDMRAVVA